MEFLEFNIFNIFGFIIIFLCGGSNNHFHVVAMNPFIGELSPQKLNSHYKIIFKIMVLVVLLFFNLYVR